MFKKIPLDKWIWLGIVCLLNLCGQLFVGNQVSWLWDLGVLSLMYPVVHLLYLRFKRENNAEKLNKASIFVNIGVGVSGVAIYFNASLHTLFDSIVWAIAMIAFLSVEFYFTYKITKEIGEEKK